MTKARVLSTSALSTPALSDANRLNFGNLIRTNPDAIYKRGWLRVKRTSCALSCPKKLLHDIRAGGFVAGSIIEVGTM